MQRGFSAGAFQALTALLNQMPRPAILALVTVPSYPCTKLPEYISDITLLHNNLQQILLAGKYVLESKLRTACLIQALSDRAIHHPIPLQPCISLPAQSNWFIEAPSKLCLFPHLILSPLTFFCSASLLLPKDSGLHFKVWMKFLLPPLGLPLCLPAKKQFPFL